MFAGGAVRREVWNLLRQAGTEVTRRDGLDEAAQGVRHFVGCAKVSSNLLIEHDDHLLLRKPGIRIWLRFRVVEDVVWFEIVLEFTRSLRCGFFGTLHAFSSLQS